MDKQAMREEAERLIRETMEKKALVIKQGNTRIETLWPLVTRCAGSRASSATASKVMSVAASPGAKLANVHSKR